MTRKEINEIKSQFNIEDCGILNDNGGTYYIWPEKK